jgi:hypothetical protein
MAPKDIGSRKKNGDTRCFRFEVGLTTRFVAHKP